MIQTFNPYSTARTAAIMSRYRPIAPKPAAAAAASDSDPSSLRKSPYLRDVWAHLQARPTRNRKRGRSSPFSTASPSKRSRTTPLRGLEPPLRLAPAPLIFFPAPAERIDLNSAAPAPDEPDLRLRLISPAPATTSPAVISPRPVRPVGSSITVKGVEEEPRGAGAVEGKGVEEAVEAEMGPAVVSDSRNKVRMCNSAYKEMVGQPECCWLDGGRIGGEVALRFVEAEGAGRAGRARGAGAFTCSARIEWEGEGGKKMCVNAACSVVKLVCESRDYQFLWRFDTSKSSNLCI